MKLTNAFFSTLLTGLILLIPPACSAGENPAEDSVSIIDPQVMLAPPGISVTAGLMSLRNNTATDIIIKGVEAKHFKRVELHLTTITDGTARMVEQKNLKIPANDVLELSHGGYHMMLYGPDRAFNEGDSVSLTIETDAGTFHFEAPVKRLTL